MTAAVPRATRITFRTAGVLTLLAVIGGAVVCATESGFECGNWPGCDADALLPSGPVAALLYRNPWIEMIHRTSAVLAGPAALLSGILAARLRGAHPLARILPWVTVAGAIVAGYVGRGIVLGVSYPTWVGAADLGSALVAMAAMITAIVALERTPAQWFGSAPGRLAWGAAGTLLAMHLVSLWAAGPGSYTRCTSWPVWQLLSADAHAGTTIQWVRMGLAVVALGLILGALWTARGEVSLRRESIAVGVLLVLVLGFGLVIRGTGSDDLGAPYSIATVGLLAGIILLAARASLQRTDVSASGSPELDAPRGTMAG